ncbi:MAG TPA: DUF4351 domain-containing protein [Pirellulales bacterium]|nr:DUF4351 domain-containing protein [Pirellulales bacterium]
MHDQRFKRLLQEFFAKFFSLFFPEWAARFDFAGLEWQDNVLGVALAVLMRVPKERRIELASEALERIVHCPENLYRKTLLCECVLAYLPTDEEQRLQFEAMVRNHPDPGVRAMELGLLDHVEQRGVEKGMQQGLQQGLQQGIERGLLEGQRQIVRELLETRFGPLAPAARAKLDILSGDRLTELARAVVSGNSLDELGLGPDKNSVS